MQNPTIQASEDFFQNLCGEYAKHNLIDPAYYEKIKVKRGLRNADGTGVMAGITQIGNVRGYYMQDGDKVPMEGQLFYRGINVADLISGFVAEDRFGFEETVYLLLFGQLPSKSQLEQFVALMDSLRPLPPMFTEDMILKAPSRNIMNKLARSVLTLYSYDDDPDNLSLESELYKAIQLVARCPIIIAHAYSVKRCYFDNGSLYLHRPQPGLTTAENFLYALRPDHKFTQAEARLLDLCMVLHAEHGGGNNSAFACRVLSSSHTDIYSSIGAAVGSLKGPRHGGANIKVKEMLDVICKEVEDWSDQQQVFDCLCRILRKETGDGSGLIYGMGHAVYTLSDPRAKILKTFAHQLAEEKGMIDKLNLIQSVEELTPKAFATVTGKEKVMCANVDLYSGFVYELLNIPQDLYTPLFAAARMVGWCAHRIEEVYNPGNKIIRPAYKAVAPDRPFIPLCER
jgi:citrate synthase